jgi:competence protein ComEC
MMEAAQEAALVARSADALVARSAGALDVDVLLVPHHGSRTSSTPAFIDAASPRWALVQAAYRSRFGHPAPDVVQRYAERGIELVRSDRCGAWTWPAGTPPSSEPPRCQRQTTRRYWHHPGAP